MDLFVFNHNDKQRPILEAVRFVRVGAVRRVKRELAG